MNILAQRVSYKDVYGLEVNEKGEIIIVYKGKQKVTKRKQISDQDV